jgi:hypothetical protein
MRFILFSVDQDCQVQPEGLKWLHGISEATGFVFPRPPERRRSCAELTKGIPSLRKPFPDNSGPRAIGFKEDDIPSDMIPVQSEDCVSETVLRRTRVAGERIVYAATPIEFLKRSENGDLVAS